ncbi:hypothetical protein [[Mycoplasma] gypis]|uniref:Uncharacterized protein n=1 Tax=[Mycoplasma] gypis TaxID=92404 RepID=A0ABZ2RQ20_9BACT|nr:hypothetical protein [[Mycoplasma] gypis]MBN0919395.1 hypothetical protein [[Mycoplasma] gypis]
MVKQNDFVDIKTYFKKTSNEFRIQKKTEILKNELIQKIVNDLNLNENQIDAGLSLLMKYKNFVEIHKENPKWQLFVNGNGFLDIDFSNEDWFRKSLVNNNFILTRISVFDKQLQDFLSEKSLEKSLKMKDFKEDIMSLFLDKKEEKEMVKKVFRNNKNINLFIKTDKEFEVQGFWKYISVIYAKQNKKVAVLNYNDLYNFVYNHGFSNFDNQNIVKLLNDVDCLFIFNFASYPKSSWFIEKFIYEVLYLRIQSEKNTFLSTDVDFLKNQKLNIVAEYKQNLNNTYHQNLNKKIKNIICKKFTYLEI